MATEQSAAIHRGGSYSLEITLLDADGSPLDPTGATLHYRVAHSRDQDAVIEIDAPELTVAFVAPDWVATVPLTTAKTLLLSSVRYYHEFYLVDNTERDVMLHGFLQVSGSQAAQHP